MFLKDRIKAKTEFRPASDVNYSFLQIDELDWGNNKVLYKSRPSQPTIVDFLINQHAHTSRNAPANIHERYAYEIEHEIAFLKNGKGKLRYPEPNVDYIWSSERQWTSSWVN